MKHFLDPTDFTLQELDEVMNRALDIIANRAKYADACHGKKLATLFYEPSTRTRLSFTSAMMELGGNVLGFDSGQNSSASKGESVADTVRTVGCFADIIAMRHFKEGSAQVAGEFSPVPVINAGDGGHSHPTQTLTDMLTILREVGRFDHLTIGLCGDLKYGRTVHSLIKAMQRYEGNRFVLISPVELRLPEYMKNELGDNYVEVTTLEEAMPMIDVLYMTRIQRERFHEPEQYERLKNSFVLDMPKMNLARKDMIVLHPLPRVNEIAMEVDPDPRAAYFRQVENGKFVRMSLIYNLLNWQDKPRHIEHPATPTDKDCTNDRCITHTEPVEKRAYTDANGVLRCYYCDHAF